MNFAPPRVMNLPSATPSVSWLPADRSPHPFAAGLLLVSVFLVVSRGVEILPAVIGVNLRLTLILMAVSLAAAVFTGGLLEAAKTPVVILFTALTCWLLLTTVTSHWRGGSVTLLMNYWVPSYACALLVPSLISSLEQCRKMFYALAFSLGPMWLATVLFQNQRSGRDETLYGTLGNPNDLAFSLLLLIPFAVFVIKSESRWNWKAIACALAIVFALVKALRTGSRAGLLCIAICFVILFLIGRMKAKLTILVVAASIAALAFAMLPHNLLLRYATIFNGTSYETDMSADELSAVESTRARKMLFEESIHMMVEYPVFGVGPGIFSAALAGEQRERGETETWHEAHNSFAQIGSEAGIPALCIYLAILFYCLKRTISAFRRTRGDPNRIAICRMAASLTMALVILTICAAFGTYSYTFHFPVLAGLVQAFDVSLRKEKTVPAIVAARLPMRSATPMLTPPALAPTALAPQALAPQALAPQALTPQVPNYVRNSRLRNRRA